MPNEDVQSTKRRAGRSPAYPFISVQKAISQAKALYKQEGEYAAPLTAAFSAWGYGPKSSGARQTLATLKYYGLIDVLGDGDSRKVKVSEIARRIILDQREDDSEKRELVRKVALMPSAHKALYKAYPSGLPSDSNVTHHLIFDLNYNKDAARDLLAQFKETSVYARLYEPQSNLDIPDGDGPAEESESADSFDDLLSARPNPQPPAQPLVARAPNQPTPANYRRAVFDLSEGEVVITYPNNLSSESVLDLQGYMNVFMKKAYREAGIEPERG